MLNPSLLVLPGANVFIGNLKGGIVDVPVDDSCLLATAIVSCRVTSASPSSDVALILRKESLELARMPRVKDDDG